MTLNDKIALINFNPDDTRQHVAIVSQEQCCNCQDKQCLNVCPTRVFKWDYQPGSPILVYYQQCVECGACRLACQFNNVEFEYPYGGYGVAYREG
ncbi:hypothetical protein SCACP_17770 [Sporomusa carbonis]|uniref:ferredoxin family protein n=1 Tax=Sporomusa carbonis TaxID=3076075 RepID=UPI003A5EB2C7